MIQLRFILSVLLVIETTKASGRTNIKGRLLTPKEGCGRTKISHSKIVGGKYAKLGAYPWMAGVGYYIDKAEVDFVCGGTLITSRHVLTAGHCVKKVDFVRLGAQVLYGNGPHMDANVTNVEMHPDYIQNTGTDIAILYLSEDVNFTDRIRPICLPISEPILSRRFINFNPFIAGWGQTMEGGAISNILKEAQVPVLDNRLCKKLYQKAGYGYDFSKRVICAGDLSGSADSCVGDSGGPLMLPIPQNGTFPFYQIGVVAFGIGCGRKDAPGGYVSTQFHAPWIQDMLV